MHHNTGPFLDNQEEEWGSMLIFMDPDPDKKFRWKKVTDNIIIPVSVTN